MGIGPPRPDWTPGGVRKPAPVSPDHGHDPCHRTRSESGRPGHPTPFGISAVPRYGSKTHSCSLIRNGPSPTPPSSCPGTPPAESAATGTWHACAPSSTPSCCTCPGPACSATRQRAEPAFVVGRTDPEEAVHPALQRPDLGEIGVERLDRAVLGEPDARLRHETGQEIRRLPEDPMYSVMLRTDHATESNRANTRPTRRCPHDQPYK